MNENLRETKVRGILDEFFLKSFGNTKLIRQENIEDTLSQLSALYKQDGLACPHCCAIFHKDKERGKGELWSIG